MLLALIIINIITAIAADPFHKYPYVFLLDVGNEEIEGTNTEQIRVTIPGGSLALKYPATDTGDTISHVRVSGVDFGTDLKADIAEGGPGYTYVVLVFMGNPGTPYDAVITVETIDNSDQNVYTNDSVDEANDSSEDTGYITNGEAANEIAPDANIYGANGDDRSNYQVNEYDNDAAQENEDDEKGETVKEGDEYADVSDKSKSIDAKKYEKYQSFRPLLYGGARIYPQASLYVEDNNFKPLYDPENHADDADSGSKYLDSNNNVNLDYSISADY